MELARGQQARPGLSFAVLLAAVLSAMPAAAFDFNVLGLFRDRGIAPSPQPDRLPYGYHS